MEIKVIVDGKELKGELSQELIDSLAEKGVDAPMVVAEILAKQAILDTRRTEEI